MKMEQSVPKRRLINFRRRRITQKKAYNNSSVFSLKWPFVLIFVNLIDPYTTLLRVQLVLHFK